MTNISKIALFRSARLAGALLAAAVLSAAGCAKKDARAGAVKEAIPVTVGTAARQDVPLEVRAIGHVEPYSTVALKARVGGEVTSVGFKDGQNVRKGDVLFQIDARPYQATLAQARAQLERDRAVAKNFEEDSRRYADLVQKDYVTKEQYGATSSSAVAALATVKADEAAVENARLQLSYCTVTAPISARAGSVLVYPGNQVKGNDDKPLVVLNQIQPVYVSFSVPESSLAAIRQHARPGEKLKVTAAASSAPSGPGGAPGAPTGELTFLDNAVDMTTGTILLKATFANETEALWPGEYVDVLLTLATEAGAVVVPSQAVQTGQSGQYVYVVRSDLTVESRPIKISRIYGTLTVVSAGVKPGERIVTDGQLRLAPGSKVEIKPTEGKAS
jgi:multidrug efflux system membrane fusion protein